MDKQQDDIKSRFWQERRVFVTGGTGLVGSWLIKALLARGTYIVALIEDADPQSELYRSGDILKISVVNGELEDFRKLERTLNLHDIDTVFHLGAQTLVTVAYRSPLPTFESNIRGTYNLLEACRMHRSLVQRIVIASSDKAYGEQPNLPYTEDMSLNGRNPYDASKSCADIIAQTYYRTFELPLVIARCGNIYGGGDLNWNRIVPGTVRSFLRQERPIIRSDGTFIRDYLYVKDAAHAYILLAESLENQEIWGECFNLSLESPLSVLEIVALIQQLMGCEAIEPDIRNQVRAEIHSQYLSAAKAKEQLGWQPAFDLQVGLRETIEWYQRFLNFS